MYVGERKFKDRDAALAFCRNNNLSPTLMETKPYRSKKVPMNIDKVPDYDVLDVVLLCHAALAQDSPEFPTVYLNQILNIMFAYLTMDQRKEVEVYLAEKKYLPPLKLHLPNS